MAENNKNPVQEYVSGGYQVLVIDESQAWGPWVRVLLSNVVGLM